MQGSWVTTGQAPSMALICPLVVKRRALANLAAFGGSIIDIKLRANASLLEAAAGETSEALSLSRSVLVAPGVLKSLNCT